MVTRITGLSSGMDIDSLVTQLMTAEKIPLDKMKQNKQTLTWKSDSYREINKQLATFNTALSKLRFSSQWQTSTATSSDTSIATVTSSGNSSASSHSLVVNSLATGAVLKGSSVSKSTAPLTASNVPQSLVVTAGSNDQLDVTLNGSKQTITLNSGIYADTNALAAELQTQLDNSFGTGQLKASVTNGKIAIQPEGTADNFSGISVSASGSNTGLTSLGFDSNGQSFALTPLTAAQSPTTYAITSANNQLSVTLDGSTKTITLTPSTSKTYSSADDLADELQTQLNKAFGYNKVIADVSGGKITLEPQGTLDSLPQLTVNKYGSSDGLTALGFTDGQSFKVSTNSTLGDQFGINSSKTLSVNGVDFTFDPTTTISSIMSNVNSSAAGVRMTYDSVTDSFSIASKSTGAASKVDISGDLASTFGFGSAGSASGTDAEVVIDGTTSHRSTNSFSVDDISYTLLSADPDKTVAVNSSPDTDKTYDAIKSFVDAYNTVQTLVKTKLNETVDKNYPPLTDDQKKDMSDDEIKLWEDKAKLGVLRSDSVLRSISDSLRQLTGASVSTLPTDFNSLYKIGITTMSYSSASYDVTTSSNLVIDETKLRAAIEKDPDSVIKLFSNQPGDSSASKTGIAQQMYTQVNSAVSQLVTKAGGLSTTQDAVTSTIGKQLHDLENDIDDFQDKLDAKEDHYYQQFSAMESAVAKGNSTLSWLTSAFG